MTATFEDKEHEPADFNYTVRMPITMSEYESEWMQLTLSDPELWVLASTRQDSDEQWAVNDADWKIEIYSDYGEMFYSSYFNMQSYTMESGFWFDGERMT